MATSKKQEPETIESLKQKKAEIAALVKNGKNEIIAINQKIYALKSQPAKEEAK